MEIGVERWVDCLERIIGGMEGNGNFERRKRNFMKNKIALVIMGIFIAIVIIGSVMMFLFPTNKNCFKLIEFGFDGTIVFGLLMLFLNGSVIKTIYGNFLILSCATIKTIFQP